MPISIGSEWRIWDLQIQTILDDGYVSISSYIEDLKKDFPSEFQSLVTKMGSEENIIKYDSKEYFNNNSVDSEQVRAVNYARLFVNYIDLFNPSAGVACITDHNYNHSYLVDELVKASKNTNVKVLPGVEINVMGVHMLVIFGDKPYGQSSYSDGIKSFLIKLGIDSPKKEGKLVVSQKSYTEVIAEIDKCGAILVYPHCQSDNGLFQERGKTDRTHLADQFNHKDYILLQSQNKASIDKTIEYIKISPSLSNTNFGMTTCSDARCLRDMFKSDKDGNYCWIKSDPTFDGLKRIIIEPIERIFIGIKPDILTRVESSRLQYAKTLLIDQIEGYSESQGVWFKDVKIDLNPGLIAIIGNKGSGKSAIADILGLVGNSYKCENNSSFLSDTRFRKKGLAKNFHSTIIWESGDKLSKNLFLQINPQDTEKVRYLPQNYFEKLTNGQDPQEFQNTLEEVVFGYIPDSDKLGFESFGELIEYKQKFINKRIADLKELMGTKNSHIASLEVKAEKIFKDTLQNQLKEIQIKIDDQDNLIKDYQEKNKELIENKVDEVKTSSKEMDDIDILDKEILTINTSIFLKQQEYNRLVIEKDGLESLVKSLDLLNEQVKTYKENNADEFKKYGFDIEKLIAFSYSKTDIDKQVLQKKEDIQKCSLLICNPKDINQTLEGSDKILEENLIQKKQKLEEKINGIKKGLSEKEKKVHDYEKTIKAFKVRKIELEGTSELPGTLLHVKNQLEYIDTKLSGELATKYSERTELSKKIYTEYTNLLLLYKTIKEHIDKKIAEFPNGENEQIHVDVGITLKKAFYSDFLSFILKNKKGSFSGNDNSEFQIKKIFQDKDLNNSDDVMEVLNTIILFLQHDQREEIKEDERFRNIRDQISDVSEFYNFLFGLDYFDVRYDLGVGDKKINELSPGERGTLLLVFYLMIDKDTIPLIIDQPEDNLDNQSVFHRLSTFIRAAKKRRQIIIVTHNPNLAIGADAEQIIYVNIDKKDKNRFTYISGSIENPDINEKIVTILEGTMIAFKGRDISYIK